MTLALIEHPSPNFNARKGPVTTLVLHYTGMETGQAALERLCDPDAGVSAHYLVEEDGRIFQLVDEAERAWHAGVGTWKGQDDMNSASVGVEIVNGGHDFGLPPFPDAQIDAVIALSRHVIERHGISASHVIGHSDMAPARKQDPGERFPWDRLADQGVGAFPRTVPKGEGMALHQIADASDGIAHLRRDLSQIGYGVSPEGVFDRELEAVITAFQRRYRPWRIDGVVDQQTKARIGQVLEGVAP